MSGLVFVLLEPGTLESALLVDLTLPSSRQHPVQG